MSFTIQKRGVSLILFSLWGACWSKRPKTKDWTGKVGLLAAVLAFLMGSISGASALTCSSYPYTFSNGTTADALQVNANFTNILTCANTLLAPLAGPAFTGQSSFSGTLTNTTAGQTAQLLSVGVTLSPTANSGSNFRSFIMSLEYDSPFNFTATGTDASTGAWFENRIINSGTIAEAAASEFWGLWAGSDAASLGTVSFVQAQKITPVLSFGNGLTSTITKAVGVHVADSQKGTFVITGQAGIQIDALSAATNNTSLLIGQSTIPAGAFAIYNASASNNYLNGNVGIGVASPTQKLDVNGKIKVGSFGSATASTVCQLSGVLSSCSSSIRYKERVKNATFGLAEIERMRPVTFKWKGRSENDFGFIAEEVAQINPLFASYKDGAIEGVKYPQLTAVLVNAVKELKKEKDNDASRIRTLQTAYDRQASQIEDLRKQMAVLTRKSGVKTARN